MLVYAILGILRYAPMSGYDIEDFINTSITHFWHAKLSQIYRTLKKLEDDGWVTSAMQEQEGARSKRVYTITATGIAAFDAWLQKPDAELDEIKLPFLVKTFFMGRHDPEAIKRQMALWETLHKQQLTVYQQLVPQHIHQLMQAHDLNPTERDQFYWHATLRFGILYEEMVLTWLREMQTQISSDATDENNDGA